MQKWSKDSLILQRREGTSQSPYIDIDEALKIDASSRVVLRELPSEFHGVVVTGDGRTWYEKKQILEPNQFIVDYQSGMVTFDESHIGKQLNFSYKGTGQSFTPASRIYTLADGQTVIDTLDSLVDKMVDQAELVKDILATGNVSSVNGRTGIVDGLVENTTFNAWTNAVTQTVNTLAGLIDDLENVKADKVDLEAVNDKLTETNIRVDDTNVRIEEVAKVNKNAKFTIPIPTYDGSGQAVHPDVLYFEDGWNGFKYWMCYTPYPYGDEKLENPSIACSHDGVTWVTPIGLTNPLDQPTEQELIEKTHLSDGIIFMRGSTMECWWRSRNRVLGIEKFERRTSTNGVNWTPKETTFTFKVDTTVTWGLSPSIIYENNKYRMWYVTGGQDIYYTESATGKGSWSTDVLVPIIWEDGEYEHKTWHIEVTKNNGIYNLINNTLPVAPALHGRNIAWATSTDGMTFSNAKVILEPSVSGFDEMSLYRASLVYLPNGKYRMYYSAYNNRITWGIGAVEGDTIDTMTGITPINQDNVFALDRLSVNHFFLNQDKFNLRNRDAYFSNSEIQFHTPRVKAVKLVNTAPQRLQVQSEQGTDIGEFYSRVMDAHQLSAAAIYPRSASGVTYGGSLTMIKDPKYGLEPYIKMLLAGVAGAGIKIDSTDTLKIVKDNGTNGGNLSVGSIIFDGAGVSKAGAIKFNPITKKHEGFDGTKWNNLY